MRNDPDARESRGPAVAVWTVTGLLVGLAGGIVLGNLLLLMLIGGVLGVLGGMFATRSNITPDED